MNFEHRGFRFAFGPAFRIPSSRERAVGPILFLHRGDNIAPGTSLGDPGERLVAEDMRLGEWQESDPFLKAANLSKVTLAAIGVRPQ